MTTKTFVVQFFFDERTRWLYSDLDLASTMRELGKSVSALHTDGARPGVVVTPLRCATVIEPEKPLFAGAAPA